MGLSDRVGFYEAGFETVDPAVPAGSADAGGRKDGSKQLLSLFLLALALGLSAHYAVSPGLRATFAIQDIFHLSGAATLLAAVAVTILLHEAGHLVAAILMKFDILAVTLGPLRMARTNGAWGLRFSLRTLFSGSVSAVPRTTQNWRERMLVVVAGGPFATLVTGAAAALFLFNQPAGRTNTFLAALTQLSGFIFLLGLIPNARHARVRNDARLLSVLRRDSEEAREILLYHVLAQLDLAGVRPRDYPEKLMRELAHTHGRPDLMLFSAHKILLWALDRGHLSTVNAWDRRCLDLSQACQPASRNLALATSGCLDVLVRNRPLDAGTKFSEIDWQALSPAWLRHRSRAAYQLIIGNVPDCLAEISHARYAFPKHQPIYAFERSLLSQLHAKALKVQPPELQAGPLNPADLLGRYATA